MQKHLFNHDFFLHLAIIVGGLGIGALLSGFFGIVSMVANAYYNVRRAHIQDKLAKKDLEEQAIKDKLYEEYLKQLPDEKK